VAGEQALALQAPLGGCEPEVQVVEHDRTREPAATDSGLGREGPTLLVRADGQVDVVDIVQRPAAQNGIPIAATAGVVLGAVGDVP